MEKLLPPCCPILLVIVEVSLVIPGSHDLLDELRSGFAFRAHYRIGDASMLFEETVEPFVETGFADDPELPTEPVLVLYWDRVEDFLEQRFLWSSSGRSGTYKALRW
jgi:hypothetical protein